MKIETHKQIEVENHIKICQDEGHVQQVAFSTYHHALTQICFGCGIIRTSMKKEDLKEDLQ